MMKRLPATSVVGRQRKGALLPNDGSPSDGKSVRQRVTARRRGLLHLCPPCLRKDVRVSRRADVFEAGCLGDKTTRASLNAP